MSLTLYYHPFSQPCLSILAFLRLTGIEHQTKVIEFLKGENKTPEFTKINPAQKIPAIDDNGFTLGESEAIVRYLINSRKLGEEFYPADPKIRAQVDKYFPFHHNTVRPQFIKCLKGTFIDILPPGTDKTGLDKFQEDGENVLKQFEEIYLRDQKYIAGDQLTIADIFMISELVLAAKYTDFDLKDYPKSKAYMERCLENQVLKEVHEAYEGFAKMMAGIREAIKLQSAPQ